MPSSRLALLCVGVLVACSEQRDDLQLDATPLPVSLGVTDPEPRASATPSMPSLAGPSASLPESASEPEILADFDFDGHQDFALRACDHCGPYGAPSYSVYLFEPGSRTFVRAPALSRLSESSLAPMRADPARKRLVIGSKSGCCVHWLEEHEVRHRVPRLMKRETREESPDGSCVLTVETRRRSGGMDREKRPCP